MLMFVLQSALLLAIAFLLGSIAGCMLHRRFAVPQVAGAAPPAKASDIEVKREARAEPGTGVAPAASTESARQEPKPVETAREIVDRPAPKPEAKAPPAQAVGKDDLKRIRGIGKRSETKLNAAGVTTYAQIAAWTPADQVAWGEKLAFPGRIEREDWVGQAKILAAGGGTKPSRRVKSGGIPPRGQ